MLSLSRPSSHHSSKRSQLTGLRGRKKPSKRDGGDQGYPPARCLTSQVWDMSCGHIWMWELDCEEGWASKNWCFWTVALEKTLERPLACQEIKPVNPKGTQSWIFIGRTDAEAEAAILWPPDAKSQLIRKDLDTGKGWRQEEKRTTEDKMIGWHHQLNGHEFEQAPGDGDGQGSLVCCSPWGCK